MLTSPPVIMVVVLAYLLLLVLLLLAELGVPGLGWLRATNRVLILLALLFLPFLFLAASQFIKSITLKMSGQEVTFELMNLREDIKGVETRVANQVSTAEQALWPMLAGDNPDCRKRWEDNRIIIGSKLDLSQTFLAFFLGFYLEQSIPGLRCEVRVQNGGSLKNFCDLKYHWIDLYVEYTGTAFQYFNIDHKTKTRPELIKF